jgi:3-hydroxyisobutyrate dehydrogenase-like beta-hydroxyacid dehydrogenase
MTTIRLAFIGFGEAGPQIAQGMLGAGAGSVAAYDLLVADAANKDAWIAKTESVGARACATPADAVAEADLILSTVTSERALEAAESAAPHLRQGQLYLDLNSCSPGKKIKAARVVEGASAARYVDVAVMDTVPGRGHTVPMLLAGEAAEDAAVILRGFGMTVEVVGEEVGQASTIKMARSVFMKGIEAILCESLVAAHRAGVADKVLNSIQGTFPDLDWRALATYHMGRMAVHGRRRAVEMDSVADTLTDLGLDPFTAKGTRDRQMWVAELGLRDRFIEKGPETLEEFLEAVAEKSGNGTA